MEFPKFDRVRWRTCESARHSAARIALHISRRTRRPSIDAPIDPRKNQLLAALPAEDWERWLPQLEAVDMPLGQVLYEPGDTLSHVYFPTTAIVSLLYVMESGASAEIAVVGNEGTVGISIFMGGESTPALHAGVDHADGADGGVQPRRSTSATILICVDACPKGLLPAAAIIEIKKKLGVLAHQRCRLGRP